MKLFEVNNSIWQEDINSIAQNEIIDNFKNSSVLITGASGLIGCEIIFSLIAANRIKNLNIKIFALARNENKAKTIFKNILSSDNFNLIIQDVIKPIKCSEKIDYIIHCANTTASKEMVEKPVDTIITTFEGTKNVLDFALKNNSKTLYLSSLEAYGLINSKETIKENDFGYIDLTNPRSSYPESKRMAENLCASYSSQHGLDTKIARLTQTFGAGISKDDNRVYAQFARCILKNEDIILKTDGLSSKNYCYITDTIIALFYILTFGKKQETYNIANKNTYISIKDIALRLIETYKKSSLKIELNPNNPYPPNTYLNLDTEKIEKLGWMPTISLDKMLEKTIKYLKEENQYAIND